MRTKIGLNGGELQHWRNDPIEEYIGRCGPVIPIEKPLSPEEREQILATMDRLLGVSDDEPLDEPLRAGSNDIG